MIELQAEAAPTSRRAHLAMQTDEFFRRRDTEPPITANIDHSVDSNVLTGAFADRPRFVRFIEQQAVETPRFVRFVEQLRAFRLLQPQGGEYGE